MLKVPVKPVPQLYEPENVLLAPPVYPPAGSSTTLLIRNEPVDSRLVTRHVTADAVAVTALSGNVTEPAVTGTFAPPAVVHTQTPCWTYPVAAAPVPISLNA